MTELPPERSADPAGVISTILGAIAIVSLVAGCFMFGTFHIEAAYQHGLLNKPAAIALVLGVIGFGLAFLARGNLKVAGLTVNLLAVVPAAIVIVPLVVSSIELPPATPQPAPTKAPETAIRYMTCPKCGEKLKWSTPHKHADALRCPTCGNVFPPPGK